ncbi:MAG: acyltransferase [Bacteroidales bacterium]|nr:acyltransferase [Bacteroidales bacterium]
MGKERLANIDLLRLISMLCIVFIHSMMYGALNPFQQVDMDNTVGLINWSWMYLLMYLVQAGVNCFVMVSGYLRAQNTSFKWKSVAKLWLITFFYSFGICLILVLIGEQSPSSLVKYAFPIYNMTYWFIAIFLGLTVISPFLSMAVTAISRRNYQILLVVLAILNLGLFKFPYGEIYGGGQTLMWFIFLYLVGAYIKIYNPFKDFKHFGKCYLAFGILLACGYMSIQVLLFFRNGNAFDYGNSFNNSFTFVTSLMLFLWAVNHEVKSEVAGNIISKIAPYALGVYLVTEHPLLRNWIWNDVVRLKPHINDPMLFPILVGACMALFAIGTIIDYARALIFKIAKVDKGLDWIFKSRKKEQTI